jgi:hypothetical protein
MRNTSGKTRKDECERKSETETQEMKEPQLEEGRGRGLEIIRIKP